jgi:hypothetical protein
MATRQSKRTIKPSVRLQPLDEVPVAGSSTGTPKGKASSKGKGKAVKRTPNRGRGRGKQADENGDVDMDNQEEVEGEEEEEEDDPNRLYCTCRQPEKGQMIECDACKDWYVVSRAGLAHLDLKPRMRGGSDRSNWAAIGKLIVWGN